ncbi:hypothetical protein LAT59_03260 [Candidatus Gracilibacteria bacterium]|nr:hypothetical protein [Candidatus Gracilibacteria bacterium]
MFDKIGEIIMLFFGLIAWVVFGAIMTISDYTNRKSLEKNMPEDVLRYEISSGPITLKIHTRYKIGGAPGSGMRTSNYVSLYYNEDSIELISRYHPDMQNLNPLKEIILRNDMHFNLFPLQLPFLKSYILAEPDLGNDVRYANIGIYTDDNEQFESIANFLIDHKDQIGSIDLSGYVGTRKGPSDYGFINIGAITQYGKQVSENYRRHEDYFKIDTERYIRLSGTFISGYFQKEGNIFRRIQDDTIIVARVSLDSLDIYSDNHYLSSENYNMILDSKNDYGQTLGEHLRKKEIQYF